MVNGFFVDFVVLPHVPRRCAPLLRPDLERGVPVYAILVETVFGYAAVVMNYVSPGTVFSLLLNSSGADALSVYRPIAVSELGMRRRPERERPISSG